MPKSRKIRIRRRPAEMRETLKALGLGKQSTVTERQDSGAVGGLIAKIPHLVRVVEEDDIVFPRGKSTLGRQRIREAIDRVLEADAK